MEQMQWIAEGSVEFSKASDDGATERKVGAGLMAGGGMGVTLGTVASGVPGFRARPGDSALRRAPGGIFGGRHASHTDVTGKYEGKAGGGAETLTGRVRAARNAGKVRAEKDVLRELAAGHRAGRIGQAGGAVMLGGGYAAKKIGDRKRAAQTGPLAKSDAMARRREERGSLAPSAMIGGGATTAAATYGVSRGLGSRAKQWEDRAAHHAGLAEQQMPGSTGPKMDERQLRKRIRRKGGSLNYEKLDQASRHAGEASQSKYLSGAYRAHAKAFKGVGHAAAATALAGAGIEAKRALGRRRAQQGPVDKAEDWRNISQSEDDRRAARRTKRNGAAIAGGAASAAVIGDAMSGSKIRDPRGDTVGRSYGHIAGQELDARTPGPLLRRKGPFFRYSSRPQGVYGVGDPLQPRVAMTRNAALVAGAIGAAGATGLGMIAHGTAKERSANANIANRRRMRAQAAAQRASRYDDIDYRVAHGLARPER